jgi:hypothetical protein
MKELLMLNCGQAASRSSGERRSSRFVEVDEGEWLVLADDRVGPWL